MKRAWTPEEEDDLLRRAAEILNENPVKVEPAKGEEYYKHPRPNGHFPTCNCAKCREPGLSGAPWWCKPLFPLAKKNARRRGIPFEITGEEYKRLAVACRNRCSITGIPFEHDQYEGSIRRPFAPSLDRIDSSKGYTHDNCRFVCVIVNLAMNEWGLKPLMKVAEALLPRRKGQAA